MGGYRDRVSFPGWQSWHMKEEIRFVSNFSYKFGQTLVHFEIEIPCRKYANFDSDHAVNLLLNFLLLQT